MTSFRVNSTPYLIPQGPSEPTVVICKGASTGVSEAARRALPAFDRRSERDWLRFLRSAAAGLALAFMTGCASYPDTRPTLAIADRALAKAEADNAAVERPDAEIRKGRAAMFAAVRKAIAAALKRGTGE